MKCLVSDCKVSALESSYGFVTSGLCHSHHDKRTLWVADHKKVQKAYDTLKISRDKLNETIDQCEDAWDIDHSIQPGFIRTYLEP